MVRWTLGRRDFDRAETLEVSRGALERLREGCWGLEEGFKVTCELVLRFLREGARWIYGTRDFDVMGCPGTCGEECLRSRRGFQGRDVSENSRFSRGVTLIVVTVLW